MPAAVIAVSWVFVHLQREAREQPAFSHNLIGGSRFTSYTIDPSTQALHFAKIYTIMSSSDDRSISSGTSGNPGSGADMSTSNATSTAEELMEEKERMFQQESRQVARLKRIVLLIMLLAAIAVSTVVYFISKNSEIRQFESMYEGAAEKLLGTCHITGLTQIYADLLILYIGLFNQLRFRRLRPSASVHSARSASPPRPTRSIATRHGHSPPSLGSSIDL